MRLTREDMERSDERRAATRKRQADQIRRRIAESGILNATHRLTELLYRQREMNKEADRAK